MWPENTFSLLCCSIAFYLSHIGSSWVHTRLFPALANQFHPGIKCDGGFLYVRRDLSSGFERSFFQVAWLVATCEEWTEKSGRSLSPEAAGAAIAASGPAIKLAVESAIVGCFAFDGRQPFSKSRSNYHPIFHSLLRVA